MSSHHEWVIRVVAEHDAKKPFAPENGVALKFKVDDDVIYTNDYGVSFRFKITGFYSEPTCALYANGARYLVNSSSPWFPVSESALRHVDDVAVV